MTWTRTPTELLAVRARLERELATVNAKIAERRLGVVNGVDHRPPCRVHGIGPDSVDRWCANTRKHAGPHEFIVESVAAFPKGPRGSGR